MELKLSVAQPKLWLLDVDGVIFIHNSHLEGEDRLVPGIKAFLSQTRPEDTVILFTARKVEYRTVTESSLRAYGVRYDQIFFDMPMGERILVNDEKSDGTKTAFAISVPRDSFPVIVVKRA